MEQTQEVSVQDDGALYQLHAARQALATVKTLPDIKGIRDKAEAIGRYAKQQQYSLEIQNAAAEIRLQAERKMGALLKEMRLRGGDRKSNRHRDGLKLADLGIDENQSRRWQQEAALPEDAFQTYIADTRAKGEELTSAAVLRQAKPYLEPSSPRVKSWCIQDDMNAIYDLFTRLWPNWQTPQDKARIKSTVQGVLALFDTPNAQGPTV